MLELEIKLTEEEETALEEISRRTGKTEGELIRVAVERLIVQFQREDRPTILMKKARGIWKDRQDLPSFRELRNEWDRI